jgi:ABC-type glycerol-3-phosphate transport system substrate-binding protein
MRRDRRCVTVIVPAVRRHCIPRQEAAVVDVAVFALYLPDRLGVYAKTGLMDASKDFLTWMFTRETFQEWTEKSLDLPMFEKAARPAYLEKIKSWAEGFMTTTSQPFKDTMDGFQSNIPGFRTIVIRHFSEVLHAGRKPEEAMKAAQTDLEELAKRTVD